MKPDEDKVEQTWDVVVTIANRKCRDTHLDDESETFIKEKHIKTLEEFKSYRNASD